MRYTTVPHCGRQAIGNAAAEGGRWNGHAANGAGRTDVSSPEVSNTEKVPMVACVVTRYALREISTPHSARLAAVEGSTEGTRFLVCAPVQWQVLLSRP